MPLEQTPVPNYQRRKLSLEVGYMTASSLSPPTKRRKQENQHSHQTPNSFWDNLSRQWLTRRALRELDRRNVWPTVTIPRDWSSKENICHTRLKRFAKHGGPQLGDLRAVIQAHISSRRSSNCMLVSSTRKRSATQPKYVKSIRL